MKFADVLKMLERHKGGPAWAEIATRAGVHYDTIARIAREKMENPGVKTVERIAAALAAMFPGEVAELRSESEKASA